MGERLKELLAWLDVVEGTGFCRYCGKIVSKGVFCNVACLKHFVLDTPRTFDSDKFLE